MRRNPSGCALAVIGIHAAAFPSTFSISPTRRPKDSGCPIKGCRRTVAEDKPKLEPSPDPKDAIRDRALALGFDAVGFAPASLGASAKENLAGYIAQGHHGDMGWMAETQARRGDPQVLWPAARSVVALALNYAPAEDPMTLLSERECGAISVYARNRDYHGLVKGKLKRIAGLFAARTGHQVKVFVDTAPLMEKPLAEAAGLGSPVRLV